MTMLTKKHTSSTTKAMESLCGWVKRLTWQYKHPKRHSQQLGGTAESLGANGEFIGVLNGGASEGGWGV